MSDPLHQSSTANLDSSTLKATRSRVAIIQSELPNLGVVLATEPSSRVGGHPQLIVVVVESAERRERVLRALKQSLDDDTPQTESKPRSVIQIGDLSIDRDAHRVCVGGQVVRLTALEFRLLVTLAERANLVQPRAQLLADVWGLRPGSSTRTVDVHVKRVRDRIGAAGKHIECVRGVGYCFNTPEASEAR